MTLSRLRPLLVPVALVASAVALTAAESRLDWHTSLDDALEAAETSGRPVLAVTLWKDGVCNSCDTWRKRVPGDEAVERMLLRYERLEWRYDGLHGKVIPWTLEHGGTSEDPSAQAFVLDADGEVLGRAPDRVTYTPARLAEWLEERFLAFDDAHPRFRSGFRFARVGDASATGSTTDGPRLLLDPDRPTLVYVGRSELPDDARAERAQVKAARSFEKKTLDSKRFADAVDGVERVRLDLVDTEHAAVARSLGVEQAPALLLVLPGAEEPEVLDVEASAASLVYRLEKRLETR